MIAEWYDCPLRHVVRACSDEQAEHKNMREGKQRGEKKDQQPFVRAAQDQLSELLGTRVRILPGRKTSHIQIDFYGTEDLNRLLDILNQLRSHPGTGGAAVPPAMDKQQKIEALRKLSTTGHFTV